MQTLNKDLKERNFRKVYLLFGEEDFLKKSYKNRLREAIAGDDAMNSAYFEGKGPDVKEIMNLADTMPFFAERRLIILEDTGFFKSAAGEELVSYLPEMPDSTCMVFVESEVDKRNRLYKKVKELGYAAELERQGAAALARWAGGILAKDGKKITGRTMDLFLASVGDDMENIRMELEKLISYVGDREVVTEEDVKAICTVHVTGKIFEMVGAIVAGDRKKAMELYEDLLTLREPPMRILYLIARQFNQVLQVKELMGKGMDKSAIASRLKIQPFVAGRLMPQARAFTKEQILSYVELCVDSEEAVKSGRLQERLAVELLIANKYR